MQPHWRQCKCGAINKYSDGDPYIPKSWTCPNCRKEKTGKRKKIGKVKETYEKEFKSEGIEGTKGGGPKLWRSRASEVSDEEVQEEVV